MEDMKTGNNLSSEYVVMQIAKVAHENHLVASKFQGVETQPEWFKLSEGHKGTILDSVGKIIRGEIKSPLESHHNFVLSKLADGWVYRPEYNREKKHNPRLLDWTHLNDVDRHKENLFFNIVQILWYSYSSKLMKNDTSKVFVNGSTPVTILPRSHKNLCLEETLFVYNLRHGTKLDLDWYISELPESSEQEKELENISKAIRLGKTNAITPKGLTDREWRVLHKKRGVDIFGQTIYQGSAKFKVEDFLFNGNYVLTIKELPKIGEESILRFENRINEQCFYVNPTLLYSYINQNVVII